jgi:predicted DNA-binding transcriptional regulator AlpA
MPKVLLRPGEVARRLGLGRTSFETTFVQTERLRPVAIGKRSVGYLEHEVDALIDELATDRKPPLRKARIGGAS